jgi:hypothetical protein
MKKLLLLLLLSVGLIGCSDADEKERIEQKRVQTIKVEGNCMENHTTVKDDYEGSIDLYVELPANIFFAVGYVSQKDFLKHLSWLESDYDEDEYWKMINTYSPPFLIEFSEFDLQDQDTIFKSKLKLNGLSNPPDPNKGGSNGKQYLSTCLFDVLEREVVDK